MGGRAASLPVERRLSLSGNGSSNQAGSCSGQQTGRRGDTRPPPQEIVHPRYPKSCQRSPDAPVALKRPELPGCSDWWTRRANLAPWVPPLQLGTTLGEPLKGGYAMETSVSSDGGFLTETENGNRSSVSEARFQLWRRVGC